MAKRFESLAIDHEISLNLHEPSIDEEETCNSESDDDDGEDSVGPCTNFLRAANYVLKSTSC